MRSCGYVRVVHVSWQAKRLDENILRRARALYDSLCGVHVGAEVLSVKPLSPRAKPGKGTNKGAAPPKPEPPRKYCTHCKRDGHDVSECRKRAAAERDNRGGNWCGGYSEAAGKKTGKGDAQVQCYKCKQFGHVAKQCPNK